MTFADSDAAAAPAESRPEIRFGLIAALVYGAILLPRIILHVFWRDELQAWMIAVSGHPSLGTVAHRVSYEGHPYAWFVLLWLAAHVWTNPMVMKLLHAAIATLIAFVIAAFAPMPRHIRLLLCAGYFISFEYAVVSRNYGLGVLPLLAFAAVRTWRPNALVLQACCLAFAAQANVYSALLSVALAIWAAIRWTRDGCPDPRRFTLAFTLVMIGLASFGVQLIGAPDRQFEAAAYGPSWSRFLQTLAGAWRAFVPIPAVRRDWWNSNAVDQLKNLLNVSYLLAVLGATSLLAATWLLPHRRDVRSLWVIGSAIVIVFGTTRYPGFPRHTGHFFILFVLAWWLGSDQNIGPSEGRAVATRFLFVVHAVAGLMACGADVVLPFSASRAVADVIDTRFPGAMIIANNDDKTSPVAGLLGRDVYYANRSRWGTFIPWDTAPGTKLIPPDYATLAESLNARTPGRPVVLLLSDDALPGPFLDRFRRVGAFKDSSIASEQYMLYEFKPVITEALPPNRPLVSGP